VKCYFLKGSNFDSIFKKSKVATTKRAVFFARLDERRKTWKAEKRGFEKSTNQKRLDKIT